MNTPILESKLICPKPLRHQISRQTIMNTLHQTTAHMVLISAPAGTGKSNVVVEWLQLNTHPYLWYSLDAWDNDEYLFFSYLIKGLEPIDLEVYKTLTELIDSYQALGFDSFLRAFIMSLHQVKSDFSIVFDDYHVINNPLIDRFMQALIDHRPNHLTLYLVTREDPALSLSRIRMNQELLEIRSDELAFDFEETCSFVKAFALDSLSESDLNQLYQKTEGWAAGLYLALTSIQHKDNRHLFIKDLSLSQEYIMDYFVEEVLSHQKESTREFLLKTSVLSYFSADLCDYLLDEDPGYSKGPLNHLMENNLFLIPLEGRDQWFKYHHLFKTILEKRLELQAIDDSAYDIKELYTRAGQWFQQQDKTTLAIEYYLKAHQHGLAANLIELKWAPMDVELRSQSWLSMAQKLPKSTFTNRPVLTMAYAWALLDTGNVSESQEWLDKTKAMLERDTYSQSTYIISDTHQYELIEATLESAYGYLAAGYQNIDQLFHHANRALSLIPRHEYQKYAVISMLLGFAYWSMGDFKEAEQIIHEAIKDIQKEVTPITYHSFYMVLGELYLQQKAFTKAEFIFTHHIDQIQKANEVPILLASFYLGLAKCHYLQGHFSEAKEYLSLSKSFGQTFAIMDWQYKYYLLMSQVSCSQGDYKTGLDYLVEAKEAYFLNPIPPDLTLEDMESYLHHHLQLQVLPTDRVLALQAVIEPFQELIPTQDSKNLVNQSLPEPLTVRELEVLELIGQGLSNKEICDHLFLALSTVKGYTQNIFGKLGVKRRTEAVAKANSIHLI